MPVHKRLWKGLLALFVLQLSIMGAQTDPATMTDQTDPGPVSKKPTGTKVIDVAKALVKLFSKDEEKIKDLTAADEAVRGLTFDLFNEKVSCSVMKGILLQDYKTVVDRFVKRYSIPEEVESSLLDGEFAEEKLEVIVNFKFAKGETGGFIYGRVATVKHDGKIDMAYSVYFLEFKLSPRVIEHEKKRKFLGFTIGGTKVWRETQERNLSVKDRDYMQSYFMKKAIEGFKEQYSGLIEAHDQHCTAENCD